ncbi:YwpF family protein [Jeotgalibacillus sp. ET6]|uniref:YwpF family protein n=1 Tax=Jeotgalibacillus sp. ET6 TaxID=3037260 RepID=UPI002418B6B6|nr:YwpF family protein [Jeotgalibacillus sp. ET6]MDG5471213.1 YwpF family protein [Jeotgalibacillus sp. ET6]
MKTFKLVNLKIAEEDSVRSFHLFDGLIINKEDDKQTWILEAFLEDTELDYFKNAQQNREDLEVLAVISSEKNDPASFYAHVHNVRHIGDKISVLFTGNLRNQRNEYAENLLDHLVSKSDLTGNELLHEFRTQMKERPRLKKS